MNVLASTSTACYACISARATCSNAARFSMATKLHREHFAWPGGKRPDQRSNQAKDLLTELKRLENEEGVQLDSSVFATGKGGPRIHPRAEPEMKPQWRLHRESLKEKFPEGWNPPRRLSRGEMNTIRRLHALDPDQFSTPKLAEQFKISSEAVRRILRSKFRTDEEIEEEKVGDALLAEAELGTYDKSQGLSSRSMKRMQEIEHEKPKFPERKTRPAKPLQEGFDASKLSSKYKWAAGARSSLAISRPTFLERKWEDSGKGNIDRSHAGYMAEQRESRPVFRKHRPSPP